MNDVYLIEQIDRPDAVGIPGVFLPEIWTEKSAALTRLADLLAEVHFQAGYTYVMSEIPVNQKRN